MRLAGHAVLKGKTINAYRILIITPEKKIRVMWAHNI